MRRRLAAAVLVALVAGGCTMFATIRQRGQQPCVDVYSENQCLAMADVAAAEISKGRGDVAAITIVPDEPPEGAVLGGAWPIRVRITLMDGSIQDSRMCGGLSIAPACTDDPRLMAVSVIGAYTDVPCAGEAPEGCATPHPAFEPASLELASPLKVQARSIPIDRVGRYAVELGAGTLPNGILSDASFAFDEAWPKDVALRDGRGMLEVRSLEPDGKPFDNYYTHGWRPGVERVEAVLRFDVLWFEPGADLGIRNLVVR